MSDITDTINNTSKNLKDLHVHLAACRHCQSDFGFEPHPILFGNPQAKIMQISQAPSRTVHTTGKPFNDASGKRLRSEWYRITDETFYNPDNFYIASIAHCFPGKNSNGGDRRPPKYCADKWLIEEIKMVQNKIYIIIGGIAAEYFFPGEKMTALVFQDLILNGKPAFVLPHPSPLNMNWFRNHPDFEKRRIIEIADSVHAALGIP